MTTDILSSSFSVGADEDDGDPVGVGVVSSITIKTLAVVLAEKVDEINLSKGNEALSPTRCQYQYQVEAVVLPTEFILTNTECTSF